MPQVHIPASLRPHVNHLAVMSVDGDTVGELLCKIFDSHPSLRPAMMNESQQIHPFFNLFVGENNIRDLQQLDTPVAANQVLLIVSALAGG